MSVVTELLNFENNSKIYIEMLFLLKQKNIQIQVMRISCELQEHKKDFLAQFKPRALILKAEKQELSSSSLQEVQYQYWPLKKGRAILTKSCIAV